MTNVIPFLSSTEQKSEDGKAIGAWTAKEEMGGNINSQHTAISPQHCNAMTQPIFMGAIPIVFIKITCYSSCIVECQSYLLHISSVSVHLARFSVCLQRQ